MSTQAVNGAEASTSNNINSDRYLRLPEVLALVGVSWRTVLRWERQGCFPKRYKIGPRIVAWKESEIRQWIAGQEVAATSKRGAK